MGPKKCPNSRVAGAPEGMKIGTGTSFSPSNNQQKPQPVDELDLLRSSV